MIKLTLTFQTVNIWGKIPTEPGWYLGRLTRFVDGTPREPPAEEVWVPHHLRRKIQEREWEIVRVEKRAGRLVVRRTGDPTRYQPEQFDWESQLLA